MESASARKSQRIHGNAASRARTSHTTRAMQTISTMIHVAEGSFLFTIEDFALKTPILFNFLPVPLRSVKCRLDMNIQFKAPRLSILVTF